MVLYLAHNLSLCLLLSLMSSLKLSLTRAAKSPNQHRWASASRKVTPASAFRHLTSQSGTGAKKMPDCVALLRYQTVSGIVSVFQSGTGLIRCRTVRHSGIWFLISVGIGYQNIPTVHPPPLPPYYGKAFFLP
jgi:hypothetical protein